MILMDQAKQDIAALHKQLSEVGDALDLDALRARKQELLVPAGEFVRVRITGVSDGDLTGEIEE